MSANIKAVLHTIVSLGANGLIFDLVPAGYKGYALLAFNLIQVLYAFFDQTYAVQLQGKK